MRPAAGGLPFSGGSRREERQPPRQRVRKASGASFVVPTTYLHTYFGACLKVAN
jgi:hypothetical protein